MGQRLDEVKDGVVKVIGDDSFAGTGFFISKQFCITCHHVIYKKNKLKVEFNGTSFPAKWDESRSSMENDFSMLMVEEETGITPTKCAQQLTPNLKVKIWGYTSFTKAQLPAGSEFGGPLSSTTAPYLSPEVKVSLKNPWNKKPKISLDTYSVEIAYAGSGLSGAPVWEPNLGMVVGMFVAVQGPNTKRDVSTRGFIIPIDLILGIQNEKIKSSSSFIDLIERFDKANRFFKSGRLFEATQHYEKLISSETFTNSIYNMGIASRKLGSEPLALQCFKVMAEIELLKNEFSKLGSARKSSK